MADTHHSPGHGFFSKAEIREILANTVSSQSAPPPPSRSSSGHSKHSSKPPSRTNSGLKQGKPDPGCTCIDCRSLAYRENLGAKHIDADGNEVTEIKDADGAVPVHCHLPPGFFGEEPKSAGSHSPPPHLRRSSTANSSKSSKSSRRDRDRDSQIQYSRNADGDMEQTHVGAEAPRLRAHLPDTEEFRHLKDDPHRR